MALELTERLLRLYGPDEHEDPIWVVPESLGQVALISFTGVLTCSASPGDRFLYLSVRDRSRKKLVQFGADEALVAADAYRVCFSQAPNEAKGDVTINIPIASTVLAPGDTVEVGGLGTNDLWDSTVLQILVDPLM